MNGVWVKATGYGSSAKRHYYEKPEVAWAELQAGRNWGITWREWMVGQSICSTRTDTGFGISGAGSAGHSTWGRNRMAYNRGLSIKQEDEVKLTQGNLCSYCKTRYIKARPELEAALKELGVI
jgi:hypothetical protein